MGIRAFLSERREKVFFFAAAIAGALADILTKYWVFSSLGAVIAERDGAPVVEAASNVSVIGDTLRLHCTVNTGAIFSVFSGRWIFLAVFTVISLGIILWIIFRQRRGRPVTVAGLALVCAGALGNLWDRLIFNGVRDFIDFKTSLLEPFFAGGHWPTFNVADIWITFGIALIFLGDFILYRKLDCAQSAEPPGDRSAETRKDRKTGSK